MKEYWDDFLVQNTALKIKKICIYEWYISKKILAFLQINLDALKKLKYYFNLYD